MTDSKSPQRKHHKHYCDDQTSPYSTNRQNRGSHIIQKYIL